MTTINTPDAVPNELITAAWGDAVRGDLNRLNTEKVERNGSIAMTGMLLLPGTNPSNNNHAVRKGYADATYLQVDGGNPMTGNLNMGGKILHNFANPTANSHAVNLGYANSTYLQKGGGTMSGVLTLSDDIPTGARAAMPRSWIVDTFLQKSGGTIENNLVVNGNTNLKGTLTMGSNINMAGHDVVNESDPRLKEVVEPITDAGARVQELAHKAFRGRWTAQRGNGQLEDMIAAPDIAVAAPYVVKGEPDAVDEQGNPKYMTVAYAHMVPLLVAALGEALDRIEELEGRNDGVAADDLPA